MSEEANTIFIEYTISSGTAPFTAQLQLFSGGTWVTVETNNHSSAGTYQFENLYFELYKVVVIDDNDCILDDDVDCRVEQVNPPTGVLSFGSMSITPPMPHPNNVTDRYMNLGLGGDPISGDAEFKFDLECEYSGSDTEAYVYVRNTPVSSDGSGWGNPIFYRFLSGEQTVRLPLSGWYNKNNMINYVRLRLVANTPQNSILKVTLKKTFKNLSETVNTDYLIVVGLPDTREISRSVT